MMDDFFEQKGTVNTWGYCPTTENNHKKLKKHNIKQ